MIESAIFVLLAGVALITLTPLYLVMHLRRDNRLAALGMALIWSLGAWLLLDGIAYAN